MLRLGTLLAGVVAIVALVVLHLLSLVDGMLGLRPVVLLLAHILLIIHSIEVALLPFVRSLVYTHPVHETLTYHAVSLIV